MRIPKAEIILPVTIVFAAIGLGISEFMTIFELTPPGAEALDEITAADQHSYALLILAMFAVASTMVAVGTGIRAFAFAAAGFGLAALLLFLVIDLPDASKLGTLGGDSEFTFSTAKAEPQTGFILEAVSSVVLGLATVAFATLRSHQLQAPLARFGKQERSAAEAARESKDARGGTTPHRGKTPERNVRSSRPPAREFEGNGASPESTSDEVAGRGWLGRLRGSKD